MSILFAPLDRWLRIPMGKKLTEPTLNHPLAGVMVLDMTVNVPGPFCSTILSDLGARVVKIEPPDGDPLRQSPVMWLGLNRGKQSMMLDLKTNRGREVLSRLAVWSDIVLEGWRPGVADRLGAGYSTLSAVNPGLIYCSVSGFGQEGPWKDRPAHDINLLALSGYLGVQAQMESRPSVPPILISDLASGLYASVAILAGMVGRNSTGKGVYVDLSMADSTLALLSPDIGRVVNRDDLKYKPNVTAIPHYGLFQCADGKWLSLGIVDEDHFWRRFCEVAELSALADLTFQERVDHGAVVKDALHAAFATRPASLWEQLLREADVPAEPITELAELAQSPQFQSRGMFVDIGLNRFLAQPFKLSGESFGPTDRPPEANEHAEGLLAELGYDARSIVELRKSGALGSN